MKLCESSGYVEEVLGTGMEETMEYFHRDLIVDFEELLRNYEDFEPSEELLQDLERSFQVSDKNISR